MDRQIGLNIQRARYRREWNQSDLALALGVDRTVVSKMEKGVRPVTVAELIKVAEALDVDAGELLQLQPETLPSSARLMLRGTAVGADDGPQLAWFLEVTAAVCGAVAEGIASVPARVLRLPPVQGGELAARRFRALIGMPPAAPVVGLSALAERVGLSVLMARLPASSKISGCISAEDGQRGAVLINTNHPAVRQRFTLAHEIAHYFLDTGVRGYSCDATEAPKPGPRPTSELRADVFASALLLPAPAVRECLASDQTTPDQVRELADAYGISHAATVSRVRALRLVSDTDARALRRMGPAPMARSKTPLFRAVTATTARIVELQSPPLLKDCHVLADEEAVP